MSIASEIEGFFQVRGYTWKVGGMSHEPTEDDIQKVINRAVDTLNDEPDSEVQLEIGHLLFKKRDGKIDVFAHFGEVS